MRLSRSAPQEAADAWQRYAKSHSFSAVQRSVINDHIQVGLAKDGVFPEDLNAVARLPRSQLKAWQKRH